jgi:hypothetical protein
MDFKEIKGIKHFLFDSLVEFKVHYPDCDIAHNWRHGKQDEWVFTDDEHVCQILKKGIIYEKVDQRSKDYVRTVCGSFVVQKKCHRMLGDCGIADNIYAFSGNNIASNTYNKDNKRKNKDFLFARYIAKGVLSSDGANPIEAYKKLYPKAEKDTYIQRKSSSLLKKENIRTMVKEEIQNILDEEEATPNWIIGLYKDIASIGERDSDRLRALDSLAKISGLFDTEKKQEQLTVWTGFTPEQLEAIGSKNTKLVAHGEKETKK